MRRLRPIFLLVTLLIGTGGYFATTSSWADLYKIKGPAWFGEEVDAKIVEAAEFTEMSWEAGNVEATHSSRDHVRVRYEFDVDGKTYTFPYEDGFAEVEPELAGGETVEVAYLPSDPERNHPVGTDYLYGDQMTGFVFGLIFSLVALLMGVVWVRGLIYGVPDDETA